jgi:endonuclease IV
MLIGAHVSTGGGLSKAIERAEEIRCDAIQIFNQSPRMWRPTRYSDDDFAEFREAMEDSRVESVAIHMIYLINPAAKDRETRKKSLDSLTHALRVGDQIGALGVVVHPGALKEDTRANARKRAVKLIKEALARSESCPIIYENTAGSPQLLGRDFDETAEASRPLHRLLPPARDRVRRPHAGRRRGDRGRDRHQGGAEAAQAAPRERLARRARLQPRSPHRHRAGRDRAEGHPRVPR